MAVSPSEYDMRKATRRHLSSLYYLLLSQVASDEGFALESLVALNRPLFNFPQPIPQEIDIKTPTGTLAYQIISIPTKPWEKFIIKRK